MLMMQILPLARCRISKRRPHRPADSAFTTLWECACWAADLGREGTNDMTAGGQAIDGFSQLNILSTESFITSLSSLLSPSSSSSEVLKPYPRLAWLDCVNCCTDSATTVKLWVTTRDAACLKHTV